MLVHFIKTRRRRYAVRVERDSGPSVTADPAPGYDDYLPHDLLHFVAEAEWKIDGGVFGQLASGSDPGSFLPVDKELVDSWVRKRKIRRKPHSHGRRSEALSGVLDSAWKARTGKAPLPEYWKIQLVAARVEPERLAKVVVSLDDLASCWHKLQVGASLSLEWPRPERRRQHRDARAGGSSAPTSRRAQGHRKPHDSPRGS